MHMQLLRHLPNPNNSPWSKLQGLKLFLLGTTLTWLLTSAALVAQTPSATKAPLAPPPDPAVSQTPKPVFEEWVAVVIDGKQCGFGSTITTEIPAASGSEFYTVHQEVFVIKRLATELKVTETSKITEDADGGVLHFEEATSSFGTDIESQGVRDGDDLIVTSRGQTQRYHLPRLSALGPEKIRRQSLAVPLKPGETFSFNTFMGAYPQATVVETGTIEAQETRRVRGVERKLWRMTDETSIMPGLRSTTWVDAKGEDVENLTVIPGIGDLHEYVTDRAECMKQPEGTEIFVPTMLRPQRAIPSPGEQAQAIYRLTLGDPTKKATLWNEGEQRVLSSDGGSYEIEVTARHITPDDATWQLPHADTPELHPYLQASSYLEINSPEIQALAQKAVGTEKNPVLAAHFIENFVREYITKKDLSIGFASAQETAKSREGDCTEHAVLCAALGRAVGLPTRCVLGFGYIPPGLEEPAVSDAVAADTGIFGFHMWAEAWVGPDKWVPMDAALHGFDVGHIAISKSALEEINPLVDLNAPVLQLMEKLKIEVVKTVPKTRMVLATPAPAPAPMPVPPHAAPVSVPPAPVPTPAPSPSVPTPPSQPPLD